MRQERISSCNHRSRVATVRIVGVSDEKFRDTCRIRHNTEFNLSQLDFSKGSKEVYVPIATAMSRGRGGNPCLKNCIILLYRDGLPFTIYCMKTLKSNPAVCVSLHMSYKSKQTGICHFEIPSIEMIMENALVSFLLLFIKEQKWPKYNIQLRSNKCVVILDVSWLAGMSPILVSVSLIAQHLVTFLLLLS